MPKTLVYRSSWSKNKPLSYSDDSADGAVNKLFDKIFKIRTKRLVIKNNKYYYCPSEEYTKYVLKFKQKNKWKSQN